MSLTILVADADGAHAARLIAWLDLLGHEAVWKRTAKQAARTAGETAFDLMFLDCDLPGGSEKVVRAMREAGAKTPVVAMTRNNAREKELSMRKQGVISYMAKPANQDIARSIIDYVASKKTKEAPTPI